MGACLRLLSDEQCRLVIETAYHLLEETGVRLTAPAARDLLAAAGATIHDERVRIPRALVAGALATAPSSVQVFDRAGNPAFEVKPGLAVFGAHVDAPDLIDASSGIRRPCMMTDALQHAALVDRLPNVGFLTASGLIADVDPALADRAALAACLSRARKPVLTMPITLEALDRCRLIAAAAAGGDAALSARPNIIVYAEPLSPLMHPDVSVEKLLYCADHRLPLVYSGFAAMGATAPQSRAAVLAQLCAESLSGLVIHQLRSPGAPFIFGGMASLMDMRTAIFSYGAPEFQGGNTMLSQIAETLGLPNFGTAGTSDAQCVDGQAIAEATASCVLAVLSSAQLVHDIGLIGNASVIAPEMIVASDEIIAFARRLAAPESFRPDEFGLGRFSAVLGRAEFVTDPYTLSHYREVWRPTLLYRGGAKAWPAQAERTFERRLREQTERLLAHREWAALDAGVEQEIWRLAGL